MIFGHYNSLISLRIFRRFIKNLFRKSMTFFDSTSIGEILNLSSKDTDYVDSSLNLTSYSFFSTLFALIGTFVILIISNYYSSIAIVVLFIAFVCLIRVFLKASMELRRLE